MIATLPEVTEIPAIELVHPLPGFPGRRRFALVSLDEDGVLCELRCLDDLSLRFLVVPPVAFFPDYAPELGAGVAEDLQITSAQDAILLLVINAGATLADTTANLMAPVVVNAVTGRASQVILDDPALPIAAPLLA